MLYLKLLGAYSARYGLHLWGYCLMDNHVHVVGVPQRPDALARALRQTHADYARYANVKRRNSGHFWQNRYFSCALDRWHCWRALAYIERNPVRAGKVGEAGEWRWSSARAHLGDADAERWLDLNPWREQYSLQQWREVLQTTIAEQAEAERIREATRTGRPLGDEGFVLEMERRLQRRLTAGKPGRPPRGSLADRVPLQLAEEIGI